MLTGRSWSVMVVLYADCGGSRFRSLRPHGFCGVSRCSVVRKTLAISSARLRFRGAWHPLSSRATDSERRALGQGSGIEYVRPRY